MKIPLHINGIEKTRLFFTLDQTKTFFNEKKNQKTKKKSYWNCFIVTQSFWWVQKSIYQETSPYVQ